MMPGLMSKQPSEMGGMEQKRYNLAEPVGGYLDVCVMAAEERFQWFRRTPTSAATREDHLARW